MVEEKFGLAQLSRRTPRDPRIPEMVSCAESPPFEFGCIIKSSAILLKLNFEKKISFQP